MSRSNLRYLVFFLIIIPAGFGFGFLWTAYPDQLGKFFDKNSHQLTIGFANPSYIPLEEIKKFERTSGVQINLVASENINTFKRNLSKFDLIFVPIEWISTLSNQLSVSPPADFKFEQLISNDFQTPKIKNKYFYPLFWKIQTNQTVDSQTKFELRLLGFSFLQTHVTNQKSAVALINYLISDEERVLQWTQQLKMSSTLKISDEISSLKPEEKASFLRSHSLENLEISELKISPEL